MRRDLETLSGMSARTPSTLLPPLLASTGGRLGGMLGDVVYPSL